MLPIGDDNSDRRITPVVNYIFLALNLLAFLVFQGMGTNTPATLGYAAVPAELLTGNDIITPESVAAFEQQSQMDPEALEREDALEGLAGEPRPSLGVYLTLLTCMFLHGGWAHLLGNMLYLWIFGDNLEDALGHVRYILFYLVTGVLATLAHVAFTVVSQGDAMTPLVGASGAISGVLGGYLLLYPTRRVKVIIVRIFTEVPAWVAIGGWFVLQIFSTFADQGRGGASVAYLAHIGGFVAGLVLVKVFAIGHPKPSEAYLHH